MSQVTDLFATQIVNIQTVHGFLLWSVYNASYRSDIAYASD